MLKLRTKTYCTGSPLCKRGVRGDFCANTVELSRHSGQGCRNPASKDGKLGAMTDVLMTANTKLRVGMLLNQAFAQPTCYRPWPGFRHPCRNDGFSGLAGIVCNDEGWSLGTSEFNPPCPPFSKGGKSFKAPLKSYGFTLIELMVVLTILAITATILVTSTSGLQDQGRYNQTVDRVNQIKQAIVNVQTVNGVPQVTGFVADMGRLPNTIHELLSSSYCDADITCIHNTHIVNLSTWGVQSICSDGSTPNFNNTPPCPNSAVIPVTLNAGWNGPYIQTTTPPSEIDSKNPAPTPVNNTNYSAYAFTDGWGNAWPYYNGNPDSSYVSSTSPTLWLDLNGYDVRNNYGWAYLANNTTIPKYSVSPDSVSLYSYGPSDSSSTYYGQYPFPLIQSSNPQPVIVVSSQNWQIDLNLTSVNVTLASNLSTSQSSCSFTNTNQASLICTQLGGGWNTANTPPCTFSSTSSQQLGLAETLCQSLIGIWSTSAGTCTHIGITGSLPGNQDACTVIGGTWSGGLCNTPGGITVPNPPSSACVTLGGTWNNVLNTCSVSLTPTTALDCSSVGMIWVSGSCTSSPQSACNLLGGTWNPNLLSCSGISQSQCTSLAGSMTPPMPLCFNIYYANGLNPVGIAIASLNGSIPQDGLAHTVQFTTSTSTPIPVGTAAISVHSGPCSTNPIPNTTGTGTTTPLYPSTRTAAVPVKILPGQTPSFVW